jgi:hypothetical protein
MMICKKKVGKTVLFNKYVLTLSHKSKRNCLTWESLLESMWAYRPRR